MQRHLCPDRFWEAVLSRDAGFDGLFVFSVSSTGIYCRPSCPARRPKREHVAFHASPLVAQAAGFRACKRCRPDGLSDGEKKTGVVAAACRRIETAEEAPSLAELAADAGLSPSQFHRVFASVAGVTPKAYAAACRRHRAQDALTRGASVISAMHEAGFNSSARFYAGAQEDLGMAPRAYRKGGDGQALRVATVPCWLGNVLVAASDVGIAAILLGDDPAVLRDDLSRRFPRAALVDGDVVFNDLVREVVALIDEPAGRIELPLDIRGTVFQQRVWAALRQIPAGETATYAEVAARIGAPSAVRAVAAACAANPIAVAVPCHRVVRSDGALAGYRWGLARKEELLARERGAKRKAKR